MERFWKKVNIKGVEKCWEWNASTTGGGYPQFWYKGGMKRANRVVWEIVTGNWPDLFVLHKCDNRLCVNPNHLFLGAQNDNMQDMKIKKRHGWFGKSGDKHHRYGKKHTPQSIAEMKIVKLDESAKSFKLTTEQVLEIRRLWANGAFNNILSKQFGVSKMCISNIVHRQTWRHI